MINKIELTSNNIGYSKDDPTQYLISNLEVIKPKIIEIHKNDILKAGNENIFESFKDYIQYFYDYWKHNEPSRLFYILLNSLSPRFHKPFTCIATTGDYNDDYLFVIFGFFDYILKQAQMHLYDPSEMIENWKSYLKFERNKWNNDATMIREHKKIFINSLNENFNLDTNTDEFMNIEIPRIQSQTENTTNSYDFCVLCDQDIKDTENINICCISGHAYHDACFKKYLPLFRLNKANFLNQSHDLKSDLPCLSCKLPLLVIWGDTLSSISNYKLAGLPWNEFMEDHERKIVLYKYIKQILSPDDSTTKNYQLKIITDFYDGIKSKQVPKYGIKYKEIKSDLERFNDREPKKYTIKDLEKSINKIRDNEKDPIKPNLQHNINKYLFKTHKQCRSDLDLARLLIEFCSKRIEIENDIESKLSELKLIHDKILISENTLKEPFYELAKEMFDKEDIKLNEIPDDIDRDFITKKL
jgi:hypothetical protein